MSYFMHEEWFNPKVFRYLIPSNITSINSLLHVDKKDYIKLVAILQNPVNIILYSIYIYDYNFNDNT